MYYDEKTILENNESFIENISNTSLFDKKKIIIINRASDKIFKIINEISLNSLEDLNIIINSGSLDKKSKMRSFFEKDKKNICVAFYPDNEQALSKVAYNFFNERKIPISTSNVNLIVTKCNGDRQNLFNEMKKIENYSKSEKKITTEVIMKLTNLIENHGVSELIDNCLAKNKKKIIYILNENNFSNEDCILITRTFLNKSKKILQLTKEYELNKNIDQVLSSARPPIFWKDKEITKQQIYKWSPESISTLIYKLNELEFLVKKNINNSIYLITDFILDQVTTKT
ncbi:DNA polymerase III subunit delta [Candidatus Pelagibacter sp.]|nr:DNA polymerase III subunit delta [Candidatus Pelagibacter sp.]